jgi:hypothetical protein
MIKPAPAFIRLFRFLIGYQAHRVEVLSAADSVVGQAASASDS